MGEAREKPQETRIPVGEQGTEHVHVDEDGEQYTCLEPHHVRGRKEIEGSYDLASVEDEVKAVYDALDDLGLSPRDEAGGEHCRHRDHSFQYLSPESQLFVSENGGGKALVGDDMGWAERLDQDGYHLKSGEYELGLETGDGKVSVTQNGDGMEVKVKLFLPDQSKKGLDAVDRQLEKTGWNTHQF